FAARATRGEWQALDSADAVLASGPLPPNFTLSRASVLRARILAELQGAAAPSAKTIDALTTAAAQLDATKLSASARAELGWELGISSMLRGDSTGLRTQLAT